MSVIEQSLYNRFTSVSTCINMNAKVLVVLVIALAIVVEQSQGLATGVLNGKNQGKRDGMLENFAKVRAV